MTSVSQRSTSTMNSGLQVAIGTSKEDVVITGPNTRVHVTPDGRIVVHEGTVEQPAISAKAGFTKALKTGDTIEGGENDGWIYCDGKDVAPFLVAPKDSGAMRRGHAQLLAFYQQAQLPSLSQLQAIFIARNIGAFNRTFTTDIFGDESWYWSSTDYYGASMLISFNERYQTGKATAATRGRSSVRFVRPYTPA